MIADGNLKEIQKIENKLNKLIVDNQADLTTPIGVFVSFNIQEGKERLVQNLGFEIFGELAKVECA